MPHHINCLVLKMSIILKNSKKDLLEIKNTFLLSLGFSALTISLSKKRYIIIFEDRLFRNYQQEDF
jgi:hypothetical protein